MRGEASGDGRFSFCLPIGEWDSTTTYKGDVVEIVFDGIELENLDSGVGAEDDEDSGHEEQCPKDCDNSNIPQGYGKIS